MCQKCARSIPLATLDRHYIEFFAHYIDENVYASVPLFVNRHDNLAIEGRLWELRRAKTARHYSRKGKNHPSYTGFED